MSPEVIVTALVTIFGGGTIAAVVQGVVSHRKGVRDSDIAEDQTALQGYKDLASEYKTDLAALKTEMRETQQANTERFSRIEAELSQERSTRWAAVQYARDLVSLIVRLLPGTVIPTPPESLADHIIVPRKDPES